MPTGWICRSRTDGVIPEEPPIVLQYELVPGDVVLKDVATFLDSAPPGTTVQIVTSSLPVREALLEWANANNVVLPHEDEAMVLAVGGCFTQYMLDLRRA